MRSNAHYDALDSFCSSAEILAAIEAVAKDEDWSEDGECYRIWADPTDLERAKVERIAWGLADSGEDELFWGDTTLLRHD